MYMDRTYVMQHAGMLPTHELGLQLWKEGVVREPRIAARMSSTLPSAIAAASGELLPAAMPSPPVTRYAAHTA